MNGLQSGPAGAIWLVFFERFIAAGMVADRIGRPAGFGSVTGPKANSPMATGRTGRPVKPPAREDAGKPNPRKRDWRGALQLTEASPDSAANKIGHRCLSLPR